MLSTKIAYLQCETIFYTVFVSVKVVWRWENIENQRDVGGQTYSYSGFTFCLSKVFFKDQLEFQTRSWKNMIKVRSHIHVGTKTSKRKERVIHNEELV